MTDETQDTGGRPADDGELIEIDLDFASMRRFQAEFSSNLSKDGLFIDTAEPLSPGSVVRFRVILPEEFVFLEGTAVVEWDRTAESGAEGPPGMALRFVTLSPQNQELVEQLVQDIVARGEAPFDLDYRPVLSDFPTDALEGKPEPEGGGAEPHDEAFRLSIRGTRPSPEEMAVDEPLVLPEPAVESVDIGGSEVGDAALSDADDAALASEIDHGFDIVSGRASEVEVPDPIPESEPDSTDVDQSNTLEELIAATSGSDTDKVEFPPNDDTADVEFAPGDVAAELELPLGDEGSDDMSVGDPPELDWSDDGFAPETEDAALELDMGGDVEDSVGLEPGEEPRETEDVQSISTHEEPEEESAEQVDMWDRPGPRVEDDGVIEPPAATVIPSAKPTFLKSPEEFDSGPEVVENAELGGPAFNVSLPETDDEPDTTPVLPDEGLVDVTLDSDEDTPPGSSRRRVPLFLGLVAVLAIIAAGAYFWPQLSGWFADLQIARSETESVEGAGAESETEVSSDAQEPAASDQEAVDEGDVSRPESGAASEGGAATQTPEDDGQSAPGGASTEGSSQSMEPAADDGESAGSAPESIELEPATAITSIDVGQRNGATVVTLRGDGSLGEGTISMSTLPSPPRVIIRVIGITEVFRPYTINASTAELTTIRIGHHEERRPPELWVVLDVTDPEIGVKNIDIRGDTADLLVARD